MGIQDFTIYDIIQRNALIYRDKPAWFEASIEQFFTFSQIKKRVDNLANAISQKGISKGDRIGIVGKNSIEYFVAYGAAAALGAIAVPINQRLSAKEAAYNLNDTQPGIIFAEHKSQNWLNKLIKLLPSEVAIYNLRRQKGRLPDLLSSSEEVKNFEPENICTGETFVIFHTAAVSGHPKGAMLSHANCTSCNLQIMHGLNLTEKDVHLNLLPIFHLFGFGATLSAFHTGALTVNMDKFDPAKAVDLIENKRVTFFFNFAPILKSILSAKSAAGAKLKSLRAVIGLDTPETIEKYHKQTTGTFYTVYGQTETSLMVTLGNYKDCPGAAGRPLVLTTLALLDEKDQPLPANQKGEIAIKGPLVFQGYWDLKKDTGNAIRNGWHHTGDLGCIDNHGYLWYHGRMLKKELIKPGGENVYPIEVENVIIEHPGIDQVVVFGVPDPKWKEAVKAVCTLKQNATLSSQELISFVAKRIASYKKPQYVEFIRDFPKTDEGKIDREQVKKLYARSEGNRM
ncbi:MAG: AMP-binding protein [Desulfobacteraceae bacterium]|nr:AMP-binding protein [Desulfobacteraceae bacterium]